MSTKCRTHLRTDLQVHLVSFHLQGTVVEVQRRLVRLVLAVHLQLVTAQRAEHHVLGELSVHVGAGQSLDVPEHVGVDPGTELLQSVQICQVIDLQNVALVQPGEEEITAEASDNLEL